MNLSSYIDNINQRYKLGNATEHTFRGDLQQLIESIVPGIRATNEPKRQSCGAPDYILTKKEIPIGFLLLRLCVCAQRMARQIVETLQIHF